MRAAHAKALSGLTWSEYDGSGGDCEFRAIADTTAEAQEHVASGDGGDGFEHGHTQRPCRRGVFLRASGSTDRLPSPTSVRV